MRFAALQLFYTSILSTWFSKTRSRCGINPNSITEQEGLERNGVNEDAIHEGDNKITMKNLRDCR